ncbi:PPD1 [Scenedesmus sp. PABB004]|nr:PPD1 [Scenedesmus sp. PABB004]
MAAAAAGLHTAQPFRACSAPRPVRVTVRVLRVRAGAQQQQQRQQQQQQRERAAGSGAPARVARRQLLGAAGLLAAGAGLAGAPRPAGAFLEVPDGFRAQLDRLDGYSFVCPETWTAVTSSGNDIFLRNPFNVDQNLFVDISSPSSSRFASVADLGSPADAAARLLDQYLNKEFMSTRLGVRREGAILGAAARDGADGRTYYDIEIRMASYASRSPYVATQGELMADYGVEWDRRFLTTLGVANKRLYELRLQTSSETYDADKPGLDVIRSSFKVVEVETAAARRMALELGCGVRVCVTGATGYVAGHIVQRLLEKGYLVHGTCRDPSNEAAVRHLQALPHAAEGLKLFAADLLAPGAFHEAVEEEQLIRPALLGTENVLAAVNASPSVRRVVVTSSTAAVFTDAFERGEGHVFTEADWNVSASATKFPYFHSKKLAEQRAYELCKAAGGRWSLCSINPGAIWGPPLSARVDGESVGQCLSMLSGAMWPFAPRIAMGIVDVRDVARAHVAAMESPLAGGRYLVNARSGYLLLDAMAVLRRECPRRWVPRAVGPRLGVLAVSPLLGLPRDLAAAMLDRCPVIDAGKAARELGMTPESYISPEVTIADMAHALEAKRMVPRLVLPVVPMLTLAGLLLLALLAVGLVLGLAQLPARPVAVTLVP